MTRVNIIVAEGISAVDTDELFRKAKAVAALRGQSSRLRLH
jgi:hypothetical protein